MRTVVAVALIFCLALLPFGGSPAEAAVETLFTNAGEIGEPVFSPDGTALAFTVTADGKRTIWLYEFAKKAAARLIEEKGDLVSPSFSPDGRTLYYCAKLDGNYDLMAWSFSGNAPRRITTTSEDEFRVECARAVFAETDDGGATYDKLFFLQGKDGAGRLCSIRADGKPTPTLADLLKPPANASDDHDETTRARIKAQADGSLILELLPGAWSDLALKGEPDTLFVAGPAGLGWARYTDTDQSRAEIGILMPPGEAVMATDAAGLSRLCWAPDCLHLTAIGPNGPVVRDIRTGATELFGPAGRLSRFAADAIHRRLAWVERGDNGYRLCTGLDTPDPLWYTGNLSHPLVDLATPALELVRTQRFVARPATHMQFFHIYEGNRYRWLDSYITVDTVWFLFHLYYDYILKDIERSAFRDRIIEISRAMAGTARKAGEGATGTDRKHLQTVWGLFELVTLLGHETSEAALREAKKKPAPIRDSLVSDLGRIFEASGEARSELLDTSIDFSQFRPRGHYENDPRLQSYFRMMMALSKFSLRVFADDGKSPGKDMPVIASLVGVAAKARVGKKTVAEAAAEICRPLSFLVGDTEDIGVTEMATLTDGLTLPALSKIAGDAAFQKALFERLAAWPKPRIDPKTDTQVVFFPQRVTLDSEIMQRLVYKAVGTEDNKRLLPKLLDVMAGLGSARAEKLLTEFHKETRFANYAEKLAETKRAVAALPAAEWTRNVYRGWLSGFTALLKDDGRDLPEFTKSEAWTDRLLNAALGSLTTLRHDTLLYNKMGGAEAGEGGEFEDWMIRQLPSVVVDPYPEVFGGLRRMTLELYGMLSAQGFLPKNERDEGSDESYDEILPLTSKGLTLKLIEIFGLLETCARKQAAGEPLSPEEHVKLWKFGIWTEHLTIALIRPDKEFYNIVQEETSLVADVFTGDQTCLEVAIGRVFELWVRCMGPRGERLHRGGIFSFYEFEQPVADRLTDSAWRKMLRDGKAPALPGWTASFISGDPSKLDFKEGWYEEEEEPAPADEGN
ncbi:MAG TPA: DUF3160 domain-containing protein [Candidatus Ozemobacteraceae bacterium]|nr:DUF3160 domain-containing protein [Candidatus Ozemobacteraceae bacterium]